MSFIGNFAAARAYKATAAYNRELYMMQSRLQKAKTAQAKAVYDNIDRPRLLKKQDSDYDFLFVRPSKKLGTFLWKSIDINIIDKFGPDGISNLIKKFSDKAVKLQSGYIYQYAFIILLGFSAILTYLMII